MKKNFCLRKIKLILFGTATVFLSFVNTVSAQDTPSSIAEKIEISEDYTWWYVALAVLVLGLAGAIFWKLKSKKTEEINNQEIESRKNKDKWDGSLDADREMEWLRRNQKLIAKNKKKAVKRKFSKTAVENIENIAVDADVQNDALPIEPEGLPVFSFTEIKPAAKFSPLTISNDEALLSAIEQTQDEYEEDEEIRDLALRVLMAFKTRNSIEALSQVALYDLSSTLRSKAVDTLMEFDHESVFEAILLACADPTREVRASAARGLTRLSFDRADAWVRIIETGEKGRICQAARAAKESGFVDMYFERLVHTDKQTAYEAFVLLALLLKADEIKPIIKTLKTHKNMNVKLAVLHLLKVTKDENALNELYSLLEDKSLPAEMKEAVDNTIKEVGLVAV